MGNIKEPYVALLYDAKWQLLGGNRYARVSFAKLKKPFEKGKAYVDFGGSKEHTINYYTRDEQLSIYANALNNLLWRKRHLLCISGFCRDAGRMAGWLEENGPEIRKSGYEFFEFAIYKYINSGNIKKILTISETLNQKINDDLPEDFVKSLDDILKSNGLVGIYTEQSSFKA